MVMIRVGAGRATSCCAKSFAASAASARAVAHGRGRATLRPLLASTSLAALLIGVGSPAAFAQCAQNIVGQTNVPSVTNSTNFINCINVQNSTVTGNVTNTADGVITATGAVTPTSDGITIQGGSIGGDVVNAGQITASVGGIAIASPVSGRIINSGTISGVSQDGIVISANVSGGISNSGRISTGSAALAGIMIQAGAFAGGISNSGTISAGQFGILVLFPDSFAGGISNTGTISGANGIAVATFNSPVSVFDSGVIEATGSAISMNANVGGNTVTLGPATALRVWW
jgi:hypothetical protein